MATTPDPTGPSSSTTTRRGPAAEPVVGPSYKWWVVFMLWFVCLFNYADRQAIMSVLPKLQQEFGFDKAQQGWISSAFMWVYAFGAPLAGVIADRVRRKHLILGGCLFWSAVTMATGWCTKLWQFVAVRALEGFGETFYMPASLSLVSDYHGKETRSKALSFHQSSVYAGTIAGGGVAGYIAEHYDWRYGFYLFGGGGMVLAAILYLFLKEPRRGQSEKPEPPTDELLMMHGEVGHGAKDESPLPLREVIAAVFRSRTAPLLMLAFLGANFVATIFMTWTPTFLAEKFDFTLGLAGLSGALFINLASAVGAPLGGVLADRFALRLPGGRMLVQLAGLLVGGVTLFFVGGATTVKGLLLAMTIFGLAKGLYDSNIFASLYDVVEPRARATAAGLMNTIGWGGGALGPLFVGYATKYGGSGSEIQNMSDAIAACGFFYLGAAILIGLAVLVARRGARA